MKNTKNILAGLSFLLIAGIVVANNHFQMNLSAGMPTPSQIFRIQVGPQHSQGVTVGTLENRVYRLEQAVAQLQQSVFQLAMNQQQNYIGMPTQVILQQETEKKTVACTITAFTNRYMGVGESENMARQLASQKCSKNNAAMFCAPNKANCK